MKTRGKRKQGFLYPKSEELGGFWSQNQRKEYFCVQNRGNGGLLCPKSEETGICMPKIWGTGTCVHTIREDGLLCPKSLTKVFVSKIKGTGTIVPQIRGIGQFCAPNQRMRLLCPTSEEQGPLCPKGLLGHNVFL